MVSDAVMLDSSLLPKVLTAPGLAQELVAELRQHAA